MEIVSTPDPSGSYSKMKVTPEHLNEFLLWRINTGILFRDGLKLVYDRKPDGSVVLSLLVTASPEVRFQYDDKVNSEAENAWDDFLHSVR